MKPIAALLLNCDESVIQAMSQKNTQRKYDNSSLGHIDISLDDTYKHKRRKVGSEAHEELKAKLKQEIKSLLTRQKKKKQATKKRNGKGGSEEKRRSKRGRGGGLK